MKPEEDRRQAALGALVREKLRPYEAPPDLTERVRESLRTAALMQAEAPRSRWNWIGMAAGLAAALVGGYGWGEHRAAARQFGEELVSNQVRAQQADRLIEVASSDRHTVKPWLAARLEFSPPVADLAADGFPLLGGRLDRVKGQTAAALVYQRNKHRITVYVWPGPSAPPAPGAELLGYSARAWRRADLNFAAVSDVPKEELDRFATLLQAAP